MKKRKIKNRHVARVVDMVTSLYHLDVPVYAANAAYFIILAAFPTVMLLLNLLSYTSLGGGALLDILENVIPSALMPSVTRLLTGMFASSSKTLVSVSALAALWSASRGIFGMLTGLNRIYGVQEDRGYVFTRLLSLVYTFLFLLVLLLTLALHVFGQTILAQLPRNDNPMIILLLDVISSRFLVLLVLQTALFAAMFMFLPNRRNKFLPSRRWAGRCFPTCSPCMWSTSAISPPCTAACPPWPSPCCGCTPAWPSCFTAEPSTSIWRTSAIRSACAAGSRRRTSPEKRFPFGC